MNVNTKVRYAIRALLNLYQKPGNFATISEISKNENFSVRYLENIFYKLVKANIVNSRKGKKGGFFLLKKPEDINLYDLYVNLVGEKSIVDCIIDQKKCERMSDCKVKKLWEALDNNIKDFLKNKTFKDILEGNF